jgi:lysophospholipase L1-like esterase
MKIFQLIGRARHVCLRALLFLALATGAACSASPTAPDDSGTGTSQVSYTAVGASDAIAIGASMPCLPFVQCPNGTGYVQVLARRLADGGRTVDLLNLGIPGAVLSPRVQAISQSYGPRVDFNFMERELPFVDRDSTVVTIFAGGNDTNVVARSVSGQSNGNPRAYVDDQVAKWAAEMAALVDGIRSRAPSARIVIANLPNFAGTPFTNSYSLDERRVLQQISVGFSTQGINPLASRPNVAVVDLLCEDRFYASSSFSPDGFHPNDNGYGIMAEMMLEAIQSSSYRSPSGSCGKMSLVPSL